MRDRFDRAGSPADLDAAVGAFRDAVAASPDGDPERAGYSARLGVALRVRYELSGGLADLDAAVDACRAAAAVEAAPPRARMGAAWEWARAAAAGGRWQDAAAGFEAAIGLLGRVAPRSLTRGDREHLVGELRGLGAEAAACCVHAGRLDRAVELFEQGRGVLLGQALDTRTDLTDLAEHYPDLAGRFTTLRDELDRADDHPGLSMTPSVGTDGAGADDLAGAARREEERRRETAEAFNQMITEIRALPSFAGFLDPPSVGELAAAAGDGPVVVVNVSRFGSHALILTSGGVAEPVLLAGLTPDAVYERVLVFLDSFDDAGSSAGARAEQQVAGVLGWLWDVLAGPVLDHLGVTGPPAEGTPWPRLWWCVSGLLSFLPVHAAGHHDTRFDATPATVVDRVISSYSPTVRALAHARRAARPSGSGDGGCGTGLGGGRVVAVAMPQTPGESDLSGAQAEVAGLWHRFGDRVTVLTGPQATYEAVLVAMRGARWAHFACHGAADLASPSANRLLLTDHEKRPLTVVDVARLRLEGAELAFLSACSTAQPGGRLADEAIHLASAFQLAGYRHVIGTLWPIGDRHAVEIAGDIYAAVADTGDVAGAVHAATRRQRNRWADEPSVWASHIHVGP